MMRRLTLKVAVLTLGVSVPALAADGGATDALPPGCTTEKAAAGERIVTALLGPNPEAPPLPDNKPSSFGGELGALSTQESLAGGDGPSV